MRRFLFFLLIGILIPLFGLLILANNNIIQLPNLNLSNSSSSSLKNNSLSQNSESNQSVSVSSVSLSIIQPTNDNVNIEADQSITLDVLANDLAPNGDNFSLTLCPDGLTEPNNGKLIQNNRLITYTPNLGFVGSDTFSYSICSPNLEKATGQVIIVVGKQIQSSLITSLEQSTSSQNSSLDIPFEVNSSSVSQSVAFSPSQTSVVSSSLTDISIFSSSSVVSSSQSLVVADVPTTEVPNPIIQIPQSQLNQSNSEQSLASQDNSLVSSSVSSVVGETVPRSGGQDNHIWLAMFILAVGTAFTSVLSRRKIDIN